MSCAVHWLRNYIMDSDNMGKEKYRVGKIFISIENIIAINSIKAAAVDLQLRFNKTLTEQLTL